MANKIPSDLQWADLIARIKAKAEGSDIPTTAAEVNALPDSTKYGASISFTMNSSNFVITAQLKDQDNNNLGSAQTIDLPLESVVVDATYDSTNKKIVLELQNGNTTDVPVGDLVNGLQSEITAQNKLSADLVDDSNSTNKFVTAAEKTKIANALTEIPIASASTLGGIKVGSGLSIDSTTGVLTATGTSMVLYGSTGQNTDGAMHQKAVTDALPAEFTTAEWNALWA